jgi:AraC-like DNA-binding protein
MTWTHRIRLTTHDAVFAGHEAALMRELIDTGKWPDAWSRERSGVEPVSLRDQIQLVQRLEARDAQAVAERFGLVDFGAAGAAVLASRDLHSAISAMNSFAPLLNLRHTVKLKVCDDALVMTFHPQAQDQHGIRESLLHVDVAKMLRFLRDLSMTGHLRASDGPTVTQRQSLTVCDDAAPGFPSGSNCGEHIRIPKSLLGHRRLLISQAEANAHQKECRKMMRQLRERALCGCVRRMLLQCPDAFPSLVQLATRFGMSARTFRRRLANQHTTFLQMLDEVRFELAVRYLEDRHLTTELIAQKLGYSESANFRAAFRRWTGSSPRHYAVRAAEVQVRPQRQALVNEPGHVQCA